MHEDQNFIAGSGAPAMDLNAADCRSILRQALSKIASGAKVLAIIADSTRDDNTPELFPIAAEILAEKRPAEFDALVAQGTHSPMSAAEKLRKIGARSLAEIPNLKNIFDHDWSDPAELSNIGELSAARVRAITGNLFTEPIKLSINKLLAAAIYDYVLIFGGVVPHEVAGFAGGAKYFFPGVAGAELTHATHWLGALNTIEKTIGRVETPTRHLIEAAADFVPAAVISISSVVSRTSDNRLQTHAVFAGDFRLALRRAAEVSRRVHVKYTNRKFRRVVALLDEHYDELWTGGKASYRLGAIIEPGGELIIYAPHLTCISETHGAAIERFGGYAPLEKIKELVAASGELQQNLCVAAHLAHVAYAGRIGDDGETTTRFKITLASKVSEEICRRVNLGYLDHRNFQTADYENDPDALIVERAGRDLYLVAPHDD